MSRASNASLACPSVSKGKPGRPPVLTEEERTQRILQAAEQVFTTAGYGAASMEEVARAAGMSKKTLYALYPDKPSLLTAVAVSADDFPWEDADRMPLDDPVAELRHRLIASAEFALKPRQVRLSRLLISEAQHAPELADSFHERVMAKCQDYVAKAIERVKLEGVGPEVRDVRSLTLVLLGAALAELHLLALFGKDERPSREAIVVHVDAALNISGFMPSATRSGNGSATI